MREVWDDGWWFEGYEDEAPRRDPVPGITVPVGPGVYTEVPLPDGSIHQLGRTIIIAGTGGSIFIPVTVS